MYLTNTLFGEYTIEKHAAMNMQTHKKTMITVIENMMAAHQTTRRTQQKQTNADSRQQAQITPTCFKFETKDY